MEIKECPRHKCKHYTRFEKYMSTGYYWACDLVGKNTCEREPNLWITKKSRDRFEKKAKEAQG